MSLVKILSKVLSSTLAMMVGLMFLKEMIPAVLGACAAGPPGRRWCRNLFRFIVHRG